MPVERIETVIVGAGQAGLAMSHALRQRGCAHLVLERHRIAERWRTERWDGLRFQFPNWSIRLPGFPFPHADPDGFATNAEVLDYLISYASFVAPPIRCGVTVTALRCRRGENGFCVETSDGPIEATNVVVATGPYQRPAIPALSAGVPGTFQLHSSRYRNVDQLPLGSVLVVGAGASGTQIAEELLRAGRQVYLSVGRHRRLPRRYRGRDLSWWTDALGIDRTPVEMRGPARPAPLLITGAYGGHTVDLRHFAAQGITLLGRLATAVNGVMEFATDLRDNLTMGDAGYADFLRMADAHADSSIQLPDDPIARERYPDPPCVKEPILQVDLRAERFGAVIWATGYSFDFGWIAAPVLNEHGDAIHRHGITNIPGLYFLGLPWLSKATSSFLSGVGDDAAHVAEHIAADRGAAPRSQPPPSRA